MPRASFSKDYPEDAELLALVDAFEAGDYRAVRLGTTRIALDTARADTVKQAARDLRSRTEPSRVQLGLLAITAVFVLVLSAYEIATHGRDAQRPTPAPPRTTTERVR